MNANKYWKEILGSILLYSSLICAYYHFANFEKLSDAIRAAAFTIGPIIGLTTFFVAMMKFEDYQSEKEKSRIEKESLAKMIEIESVIYKERDKAFKPVYFEMKEMGLTPSEIKILIARNLDIIPKFAQRMPNFTSTIDNLFEVK